MYFTVVILVTIVQRSSSNGPFISLNHVTLGKHSACRVREWSAIFPLCPKIMVKMKYVQLLVTLYDQVTLISIGLFPLPLDILQISFRTLAVRIRGDANFKETNSTLYDAILDAS